MYLATKAARFFSVKTTRIFFPFYSLWLLNVASVSDLILNEASGICCSTARFYPLVFQPAFSVCRKQSESLKQTTATSNLLFDVISYSAALFLLLSRIV